MILKKWKVDYNREYFRLRKCKHKAIFYFENNDIYIVYIGKREEVYDLWKNFLVIDQITKTLDVWYPNHENTQSYERILSIYRFVVEKISEIGEKMILL